MRNAEVGSRRLEVGTRGRTSAFGKRRQARRAVGIKPGVKRSKTPGITSRFFCQAPERGDGTRRAIGNGPRFSVTPLNGVLFVMKPTPGVRCAHSGLYSAVPQPRD